MTNINKMSGLPFDPTAMEQMIEEQMLVAEMINEEKARAEKINEERARVLAAESKSNRYKPTMPYRPASGQGDNGIRPREIENTDGQEDQANDERMKDYGSDRRSSNGSNHSRHTEHTGGRRRDDFHRDSDSYTRRQGGKAFSRGDHYSRRSRSPHDRSRDQGYGRREDHYDGRSGYRGHGGYRRRSDDRGDRYRNRSPDHRNRYGRREDYRREDHRREDHRREDGPREDRRREDGPREDHRREDGPREGHRRDDGPRRERRDSPGRPRRNHSKLSPDVANTERTVFVQQLASRLKQADFSKFFSQVGVVVACNIVYGPRGLSKGFGYVEFKDMESVEKAINLTGQQLKGVPVIVQRTEAEKNLQTRKEKAQPNSNDGPPGTRLFVGNINFSVTEEDLKGIFEQYGEVEICQLYMDEQTGRSKGSGFVQFTNAEDALAARLELNNFELVGRIIRVSDNESSNANAGASKQALAERFQQARAGGEATASFSGAGGRGTQAGGAINFTSRDDKNIGLSALDDSDVGGVNYNNFSRESLMKKLARTEESAPATQGPGGKVSRSNKAPVASFQPSRCILIKNAYDEAKERSPTWVTEVAEDFATECSRKYGQVVHYTIPDNDRGDGPVYVKFKELDGGDKALKGLNGRLFAGRLLNAQPVIEAIYHHMFPKARDL